MEPEIELAIERHVLVVGGGNIEPLAGGGWATKRPIADYINGLGWEFGHCAWIVQTSGTYMYDLPEGDDSITGRLDPERVRVVPLDYASIKKAPYNWLVLLREALRRPYAILFLPAILTLVPVVPLVGLLSRRMAVYLAGDYERPARDFAREKWFGWSTLYRRAFELALSRADVVIARGRWLAETAKRMNDSVAVTVPLAQLDFDALVTPRRLEPDSARRVLFLGLLIWSKGIEELLRAHRLLCERHPESDITLDLLGEGPDRRAAEALCAELGLERSVHFRGWVEGKQEIEAFFEKADLVVVPSSTHPDGVPRSIDEALVRGIPVVATRIAGVPADFPDGEVRLVDCGDVDDLALGMEEVLFDRELRQRYIDGALRRREHWLSAGTAAAQHARILREEEPLL